MRKFYDLAVKGENAEGDMYRACLPGSTVNSCVTVIRSHADGELSLFNMIVCKSQTLPKRGLVFLHERDLSCPQDKRKK